MAGSFVTEDLATMFDDDELALVATVGTTTFNGHYDREYVQAGEMVSGANPVFETEAANSSAAVGSTITIAGTAYTIRDRQPVDDGNVVRLQLEKQ